VSWQAVKAAYAAGGVDPTARFVLVTLAFRAGTDGRAWPSIARVCADTGYTRRTVTRAIARLVDTGHLRVIHNHGVPSDYAVDPGLSDPGGRDFVTRGRDFVTRKSGLCDTQTEKRTEQERAGERPTPPGPTPAQQKRVADNGWKSTAAQVWDELADGTVRRRE
jgi:hypothetical protein